MTTAIFIPARMSSVRLPGKPLAEIDGKPMIVHVWERAVRSGIGPVYVASGDEEILSVVQAAGGDVVATDQEMPSGSDRIYQALLKVDPDGRFDKIVNLQGDLPDIDPEVISKVLIPLNSPDIDIGTLVSHLDNNDADNPSNVKVACVFTPGSLYTRALYFSRQPIPWGEGDRWHHIGIYSYKRESLHRFVTYPQTLLERREKLEQLRALEAGLRIGCSSVVTPPFSIDTPEDLKLIQKLMAKKAEQV
ncbi:3-deoxy-manno-octulosonate cytidylyltransferase [Entomobacter blattae]|uniref:8-amino-3,8-dideoxy-manno-octulosonate cytidylyltransferase n=2 Tax=Entomobacter blattae TaxID=2762277 RepID=A0A7H1NSI8_9PROT|nr:8-amino-3,8-dideoxy-manno-octulosonate cytidylyltransferase [Entomobacter blattae]